MCVAVFNTCVWCHLLQGSCLIFSLSPSRCDSAVGDRVSKREQERDELWRQLDRLKLQYDQRKSSTAKPAAITSRPNSTANRPAPTSSPSKKSVSSLSSKFNRFNAKSS